MKKIKLDLDDLKVESFDTLPADAAEGEVFGYQCPTYPGCPTCDSTCPYTCASTCAETCESTCTRPVRVCYETVIGPQCGP